MNSISPRFRLQEGRKTFINRLSLITGQRHINLLVSACHKINCSDSRLMASMKTRAGRLISPPYQQQPLVNSKGSACGKGLKCIIYALVDLIETENVMFHSTAPLISRQSPTNVVAQLQPPHSPHPPLDFYLVRQIRQRGRLSSLPDWAHRGAKEAEVQHYL